ncbi:hypothetical protein BKN38_08060 [Helicobacter sp. CLO-3]|nr:hypothetical protein BKN38_08060 [Helicobacter sp. CLO-3]
MLKSLLKSAKSLKCAVCTTRTPSEIGAKTPQKAQNEAVFYIFYIYAYLKSLQQNYFCAQVRRI